MVKYYIANWKMNLHRDSAVEFIEKMRGFKTQNIIGIAPSFTLIHTLKECQSKVKFKLGAQNIADHSNGAYTGEVSALMLKDAGVDFAIIGHSERRHIFHESNEQTHAKILRALDEQIDVVLCVGETKQEREAGLTHQIIQEQIKVALGDIELKREGQLIIAYEPVWAIGTGVTPTLEQIDDVHKKIHILLKDMGLFSIILYGGSVNPENYQELIKIESVDGFLIGGASLKAEDFMQIIGVGSISL